MTASVDDESATTAPGPVLPNGRAVRVVVTIANTGNVPLVLDALDTGELGALDCGEIVTIAPDESIECTIELTPPPGNYVFPLLATLSGPDATLTDGEAEATSVAADTTLFFQVLEPGVEPPDEVAVTGFAVDWTWYGMVVLALLLTGTGLFGWAARRRV